MRAFRYRAPIALALFLLHSALAQEPWTSASLLRCDSLAKDLEQGTQSGSAIIFVGFPVLYRAAHIPNAILAGPASKPEGLAHLKEVVRSLPRNTVIILYCGCCPFSKCPNVRPAYAALHQMGFSILRVILIPTDFHTDWVAKGYPVQKGG